MWAKLQMFMAVMPLIAFSASAQVVTISMEPVGGTPMIPEQGGTFDFVAELTNTTSMAQSCDVWTQVTLPDCTVFYPAMGPYTFTLPGGAVLRRERTQNVPGMLMAGDFWYEGRVGDYPSVVWDADGFYFTKTGDGIRDAGFGMQDSGFSGWANTGESFDVVNEMALQPISLRLAVRPNPFNPSTALSYKLQAASHVSLKVYDTGGRLVAALVEGWRAAGEHQAIFDGTGLASGIYLAKLTATSGSGTTPTTGVQKLVLLK